MSYIPFGEGKRDEKYKLVDPFCLFYLRFVKNSESLNEEFWVNNVSSPSITAWSKHEENGDGTQIDLIIERNDNIVNMCEMQIRNAATSAVYLKGTFLPQKEHIIKKEFMIKLCIMIHSKDRKEG